MDPVNNDTAARFHTYYEVNESGCWVWQRGSFRGGYGQFWDPSVRRSKGAHRYSYELAHGAIAEGMVLDHLCRNPPCVNPAHLEPVTQLENSRRGIAGRVSKERNARITHCPQGHAYDEENTFRSPSERWPARRCRICRRAAVARWAAKRKATNHV